MALQNPLVQQYFPEDMEFNLSQVWSFDYYTREDIMIAKMRLP